MTNLLLHIINVLLFFSLVHQLAGDAGGGTPARAAATLTACAAASLFAVHSMMTEAVGYVSGRSALLSGAMFLSSLLCVRRTFVIGGRPRMEIAGCERIATGHVREADECMHEGESPRMIECQPGEALAVGQTRRFSEVSQLPAVHDGLEDVLLNRQVPIGDGGHRVAEVGSWSMALGTQKSLTLLDVDSVRSTR